MRDSSCGCLQCIPLWWPWWGCLFGSSLGLLSLWQWRSTNCKSRYGLRQASRNFFSKFATSLHHYGFQNTHANHSLFTFSSSHVFLVVLVHVDDLLLFCNDSHTKCYSWLIATNAYGWKILGHSIISLALRWLKLIQTYFSISANILLISSPRLVCWARILLPFPWSNNINCPLI